MKNFVDKLIIRYPRLYELFKFCLVGGLTTVIDMVIMAVVIFVSEPEQYTSFWSLFVSKHQARTLPVVIGTGLGFFTGTVVSYLLSISFVFKSSDTSFAKTKRGFASFALLATAGLGIHLLGMFVGYDLLRINEWLVKIFLTFVVLAFNYLSRKFIVFKKRDEIESGPRTEIETE